MTDYWDKSKRDYFGSAFSIALEKWKEDGLLPENGGKRRTQDDFCLRTGIHRNSISAYKKGYDYPKAGTLERICSELGVNEDYFTPSDYKILNEINPKYHRQLELEYDTYSEEIGLDKYFTSFVTGIENIHRDFPLRNVRENNPFVETVKTDSKYQLTDDLNQTVFLKRINLDFLKRLQDEVTSFIRYKMYEEKHRFAPEVLDFWIDHYTKHCDVTREEILENLVTPVQKPSDIFTRNDNDETRPFSYYGTNGAVKDTIEKIEEKRGKPFQYYISRKEIESWFPSSIDEVSFDLIDEANIIEGNLSDEQILQWKQNIVDHRDEKIQEKVQQYIDRGWRIIEDGTNS